jgi:protein gp37
MAEKSQIAWTHSTFNPWMGCTKVSDECAHCYAEKDLACRMKGVRWGDSQPRRIMAESNWSKPYAWDRKAARTGQEWRVFCGSLCDVLDDYAPDTERQRLFETSLETPHLTWLLLTKRERNFHLLPTELPANVWVGVTAGKQEHLVRRVDALKNVNAAVRFVSFEPALGPLDLSFLKPGELDWLICGCESGSRRRGMEIEWARSAREQCAKLGVAFYMKQLKIDGEVTSDLSRFPKDLRVREYPEVGHVSGPERRRRTAQRQRIATVQVEAACK